jgi:5-(carboxyamino)imidazole ribonucleotide mutase
MPSGVPVATVALNGAKNAGILAAQIVGATNDTVSAIIASYKEGLQNEVTEKVNKLKSDWNNNFDV